MEQCSLLSNSKLPEHYSAKYKGSFAYITIKDRLPVILVKVVDTLCQNRNSIASIYGEDAKEDLKDIIGQLSQLQNEMVTDKPIKPLECENQDSAIWNKYLNEQKEEFGFPPSWFQSAWLYVECYLYRRIKQAFYLRPLLKDFDPFHIQKEESFTSTMDAVLVLCNALKNTQIELQNVTNKSKMFSLFRQYLEVSLWGNKWDLSISAGKENIKQTNPLSQLEELRKKIIANDTDKVFQILQSVKKCSNEIIIDFVLDNAGFELFCDLCFMHFLQSANLVHKIRIYVKMMPWFVSDTLEKDIHWLLKTLSTSNNDILVKFSQACSEKLSSGQWVILNEHFWTLPHDFSEMQRTDPTLYHKLSQSDLVIFKGDLNYRKLTGDRQWNESTTFEDSLNGFLPSSVVTLRTIKADVVVGLPAGTCENIASHSEKWKYSGDFAVVQCASKILLNC